MRALVVLAALSACSLNVDYKGTSYQCNPDGSCPVGFTCESKLCVPTDPVPPACARQVANGSQHACAIRNDGSVWCWGRNDFGQLGDNTITDSTTPVQVIGVKNAVAVGAGEAYSCALDKTGAVWCWGHNDQGQLGDGSTSDSRAPVQTKLASAATAIAIGVEHACAMFADQTIACWGSDDHGELGDGGTTSRGTPAAVSGITATKALVAGDDTTCALDTTGTVRCWGENGDGQLGDGTTTDRGTPTAVAMLPPVVAVAAGGSFTCANDDGGAVYCWGDNTDGQLGIDTVGGHQTMPVQVDTLVLLHAVGAGDAHACALDEQDRLWCWGYDGDGRLGDGTFATQRPTPTLSLMPDTAMFAGGGESTCAVDRTGAIRCAGFDRRGQLGDGRRTSDGVPVQVPGITGATAIAAGYDHTCAVVGNGVVKCWGASDRGQLGDGSFTDGPGPSEVVGISAVTSIVAGTSHTCALTSDQFLFCWGANDSGQLGSPGPDSASPMSIGVPPLFALPQDLGAGDSSSCALVSGTAVCWGGQFGATPVSLGGFSDVKQVTAGGGHQCVVRAGGVLDCWGSNSQGQLGLGSDNNSNGTPTPPNGITNVQRVGTRGNITCALLADGTVKCMGYDGSCNLGNGNCAYDVTNPAGVGALSGAVELAVGWQASCARKSDGSVWCWGPGYNGEIGDGQYTTREMAVQVPGLSAAHLAVGGDHACAIDDAGAVWCWGLDTYGELGDGIEATPRPVGVAMTCP